jgi:RimJ/RimL family protein N-acetyltransferase
LKIDRRGLGCPRKTGRNRRLATLATGPNGAGADDGRGAYDGGVITERLSLRRLVHDDAPFIVELVNDPDWIHYIGERNVRSLDDARRYLDEGPLAMYRSAGYGLYLVELRATAQPLGLCGLIRREGLDDADLGFAFLPAWRGRGFAYEASLAILDEGRDVFGLTRVVAIVSPDNLRSIRLLERLGLAYERNVRFATDGEEVALYGRSLV